jgi:hypothetical protein
LWRDALQAQLDGGVGWAVEKQFGEALVAETVCPAPLGDVPPPQLDRMTLRARIHVFEMAPERIVHHQYQKAVGSVWLDVLRFSFSTVKTISPSAVCAPPNVSRVRFGNDGKHPFADVALLAAAPAGKEISAGLALLSPAVAPDKEGFSQFTIDLAPRTVPGMKLVSVVTFPLGSDVVAIDGLAPDEQRLLSGYMAYYFVHTNQRRSVQFRYRISEAAPPLSLEEVQP